MRIQFVAVANHPTETTRRKLIPPETIRNDPTPSANTQKHRPKIIYNHSKSSTTA